MNDKDFSRRGFVKTELAPFDQSHYFYADPRIILTVSPRAIVSLAPEVWLMAKKVKHAWSINRQGVPNDIVYGPGLTPVMLSFWFTQAVKCFTHPMALEVDCSRWDAHLGVDALECERTIYSRMGLSAQALYVITQQFNAKGRMSSGRRFQTEATRKSGDPNTSLGNTLLNGIMHHHILTELGIIAKILVCGDDMLAIYGANTPIDINRYKKLVSDFGHDARVIKTHSNPFDASFCSGYFWPAEIADYGALTKNWYREAKHSLWMPLLTSMRCIFGPSPARFVQRFGYTVSPSHPSDRETFRGAALSVCPQGLAVPIVREMLLKYVGETPSTVSFMKVTDIPYDVLNKEMALRIIPIICAPAYGMLHRLYPRLPISGIDSLSRSELLHLMV